MTGYNFYMVGYNYIETRGRFRKLSTRIEGRMSVIAKTQVEARALVQAKFWAEQSVHCVVNSEMKLDAIAISMELK